MFVQAGESRACSKVQPRGTSGSITNCAAVGCSSLLCCLFLQPHFSQHWKQSESVPLWCPYRIRPRTWPTGITLPQQEPPQPQLQSDCTEHSQVGVQCTAAFKLPGLWVTC